MNRSLVLGALAALVVALACPGASDARRKLVKRPPPLNELDLDNVQRRNVLGNRLNNGWMNQRGGPAKPAAMIHPPWHGRLTAKAVQTGIDDALLFLRSRQAPDGSIGETHYARGGPTALVALAMLAAGADPMSDPALMRALNWLQSFQPDNTYVRGIRANVWEYALRKAPLGEAWRTMLQGDLKWLLAARNEVAWRYNQHSRDWDNSCTQYALLGLWAAERAGLSTGDEVWDRMSEHFRKTQNADGGWGYVQGSSSTPNMATAGLASLFLVFDHHYGRKAAWRQGQPTAFADEDGAAVLAAISRGLDWLGQSEGQRGNAYYLYGIERTGVASGRRLLGGVDWFAEGAASALAAQRADGAFPLGYSDEIGTALTTLFLVYGGAPPAVAKLNYGDGDDWNLNPRDVANLSRRLWQAYERPLNWQIVSIDDPVDAFEAPILFISGHRAVTFSDAQVATLRSYIERGGLILAEPADRSAAFRSSMEALAQRLFPPQAHPDAELTPLPADHPIYRVVRREWQARPQLAAVSDGVRAAFVLSEGYLAADWQTDNVESDAFALAMNLVFYASDLGALPGRFAGGQPESEPVAARPERVIVARVEHGADRDWAAAGATWAKVGAYTRHTTGFTVAEAAPVRLELDALTPTDGSLTADLLHITGRRALELSLIEQAALRRFVEAGGTVLVDAWGGSEAFAASARAQIEAIFGGLAPLDEDSALASGLFAGGVDLTHGVRFRRAARRALRVAGEPTDRHQLEVATLDGRLAVIFSRFDVSGGVAGVRVFDGAGYAPESGRRVLTQVVAWLAGSEQG